MKSKKVLLVEDEAITILFLTKVLERLGHSIIAVTARGEEALDLVKTHEPDLVIMDIGLAGDVDGIEAAHQIRRISNVHILFASGYNNAETLSLTAKIPFTLFRSKPLGFENLRDAFDTLSIIE